MTTKTEGEIFLELQQALKDISENWDNSPNSLDYQANQQFAKILADAYESLQQSTGIVDIYAANRQQLKNILALLCIPFLNATKSTVTLTATGESGFAISSGFRITDVNENVWIVQDSITIPDSGTIDFIAFSGNYGAIPADKNTINANIGNTAITNNSIAILGRPEQTDNEIRDHIQKSAALPSRNQADSIQAHLYNIDGVINCFVDKNENNFYIDAATRQQVNDGDDGALEPNSTVIFVQGGNDDEIAEQILLSMIPGISMNQNSTFSNFTKVTLNKKTPIVERVLSNGSLRVLGGNGGDITFFRIKEIDIYIKFSIHAKKNQILAGDSLEAALKKAIIDYSLGKLAVSDRVAFTVAEDMVANFFSEPINVTLAETGYFSALQVSLDGSNWNDKVDIGYGSIAVIKDDNISITRG